MYFLVAVLRGAVLDAVVMSKNRPRERAERKTDFFIITITNKTVFYCISLVINLRIRELLADFFSDKAAYPRGGGE